MDGAHATTRRALKEWPAVIAALREGRQVILLRKGGIHEPHGSFQPVHGEFFFFPSREHQRADLLKQEEAARYAAFLESGPESGPLRIDAVARLAREVALDDPAAAFKLSRHHIWNDAYVRQRAEYRPEKPLHVLILRVQALPRAVEIPRLDRYAGCRSWVELEEAQSTGGATPVLDDAAFARRVAEVEAILADGSDSRGP